MGLAIKEGIRGMESGEKVELKEEDHRKRGRVIVEGGRGGKSDVWRESKSGLEKGCEEEGDEHRDGRWGKGERGI